MGDGHCPVCTIEYLKLIYFELRNVRTPNQHNHRIAESSKAVAKEARKKPGRKMSLKESGCYERVDCN